MKKSKVLLEVIDLSKSTKDWQVELFNEGANVAVIFWVRGEEYMFDQDVLSSFPDIENLDLGEVYLDDNGLLVLETYKTIEEIKETLFNNDYYIK